MQVSRGFESLPLRNKTPGQSPSSRAGHLSICGSSLRTVPVTCPMLFLDWLFGGWYVTTCHVLAGLLTDRVRDHLLAFVAAVQVDQCCL